MMNITTPLFKHFNDLSADELHDILRLRLEVFVVEQTCIYQDLDGKDKDSIHMVWRDNDQRMIGTCRVLPPGLSYPELSIGRIVTSPSVRGKGLGHQLMREVLAYIQANYVGSTSIRISAQSHLEGFYQSHGFVTTGKEYLEDGIPHMEMLLT
jgi:ElaA protein